MLKIMKNSKLFIADIMENIKKTMFTLAMPQVLTESIGKNKEK